MNLTEKQAFVKANKSYASTNITNKAIDAKNVDEKMLDGLIAEIKANPEFVADTQDVVIDETTGAVDTSMEMPTPVEIDNCGLNYALEVVKLTTPRDVSKSGSIALAFGKKQLYCNNPKLMQAFSKGLVKKGDIVYVKFDSVKLNTDTGQWNGDVNLTATPALQALQEKLDAYTLAINEEIRETMLSTGLNRKEVVAIFNEQAIAELKAKKRPTIQW
jgi:hypothetical protein